MKWHIDENGTSGNSTLVMIVTKKGQRQLQSYLRRDRAGKLARHEPAFDSDDFLYELIEDMFTNDYFTWLPNGTTADMTSAPVLGILGDEMPGPTKDKAQCSGLYHCGRWDVEDELREMYQPVLQRWAFMDYALTSPQRELAETGRCEWEGGTYWSSQDAAVKAVAEFEAHENENATTSGK